MTGRELRDDGLAAPLSHRTGAVLAGGTHYVWVSRLAVPGARLEVEAIATAGL